LGYTGIPDAEIENGKLLSISGRSLESDGGRGIPVFCKNM
jgi:hypothetical protein